MLRFLFLFFFLSVFLPFSCVFGNSNSSQELMVALFSEGITVDLREPVYSDGELSTEQGGVIKGPHIRIQARKITYKRKQEKETACFTLTAEGDLLVEYYDYLFVGEKLTYDFNAKSGLILNGRMALEPWFFGGKEIELCADGSYLIREGFITTAENKEPEWHIHLGRAHITQDQYLHARDIQLRFVKLPLLWVPSFCSSLDAIFDSPIKYRVRWGGHQGPRFGLIYEFVRSRYFSAFLRLDYLLKRGIGGGIETEYRCKELKEFFLTNNYVARDSSLIDPDERNRYRFQGIYGKKMWEDKLSIDLSYDKLSDREMETDYYEKGLELKTAPRSQCEVRYQIDNRSIVDLFTSVRLNNFQTIKQELPCLSASFHPIQIGSTGIISDNQIELSYLDFKYSNFLPHINNYNATRCEFQHYLYRPYAFAHMVHTPQTGVIGIHYGNSRDGSSKWLALASLGYGIKSHLSRSFERYRHFIEPYVDYHYYTLPTISPDDHYIFDIQDGWYRLNMMRFGCHQLLYRRCNGNGHFSPYLSFDLYANAFFNTRTFRRHIPYVYTKTIWDLLPTVRQTINQAWDLARHQMSFINYRIDVTINSDLAFATEYRYRNAFAWRKVDFTNFFLESFRSESALLASALSDKRQTLLFHAFCRLQPNLGCEFELRHGWGRRREPNYTEYEVDLLTSIGSAWHFKLSYQHREHDDRIALYVNIGARRPTPLNPIPCE